MNKHLLTLLMSGLFVFGYSQVPNLEWARRMGSTSFDRPEDLAVDGSGNVFTTGFFTTTADFDPGAGVLNLTSIGGRDVFISKLDPSGNLLWAKQIGGTTDDQGFAIALDNVGNIYLAGSFSGTVDFDPGAATFNQTAAGVVDIFLVKLDPNGDFLWANRTGSTNVETPYDMAVDGSGNIHMTGFFIGTVDFDPQAGIFNLTAGARDVFVTKLTTDGDLIWAKQVGGTESDEGRSINVDDNGNVYTTGYFQTTVDFDPGAAVSNLTSAGSEDIFISKLDVDGNFVWAAGIGDLNFDTGQGIKTDGTNVYVTGYFQGTADFDPGTGVSNLTSAGDRDIFVSKFDLNGNLVWARNMGGTARDDGSGIAVDADGNVYTTGFFNTTADFDPGAGVVNQTASGGLDVFISKLNASGSFEWVRRIGGSDWEQGTRIEVDDVGNIYGTGQYRTNVDFDPGPCSQVLNANTQDEIFMMKFRQEALVGDPTISSFSPLSGNVGNTVTITGTNFDPVPANNIVQFNGIAATVSSGTTTTLTTTVPAGATSGKITVIAGCIGIQSVGNYTVGTSALPTITSFTPTSGPVGTTVTITGTNFDTTPSGNVVQFNATTATVTASTATSITTSVPAGAVTGKITVTVAGNSTTSASSFTVTSTSMVAPGLEWARAFGSLDTEVASMTTDASGNVYTAGQFDGTVDFDPESGVFNVTSAGNGDAFVSKFSSTGALVWAFRIGGTGNEGASQIEVDGVGNVYVSGTINTGSGSVDFDPGPGITPFGPGAYISKFDADGNSLWVLPLAVSVNDIEFDAANNLYMVGTFSGTVDFDPGVSTFNMTAVGSGDFFVMSLTSDGNFIWANRIGGTQSEVARSLALDASGNVCVTGVFFSPTVDFDPGAGTANLTQTGVSDIFILKLDNAGNFVWVRQIGSASGEGADDIATDGSDNILITGSFNGTLDFDPGAGVENFTSVGGSDAFVLKLNSAGNYVWAKSVGGSTSDSGQSITTDATGDIYYTGEFQSTADFDPGPGVFNLSPGSARQVFVSKLSASGNFLWALSTESAPGPTWAFSPQISLTPTDEVIVAGELEDGTADFDPGICVVEFTATAGINTFVMKLNVAATCGPSISSFTPATGPIGTAVTITGTNFSPTPASNTVLFNGTTAVVTASTTTSISVTVPAGATTGPITVTVAGNTATSATNFIVTATPVISITTQPSDASVCSGDILTFSVAAGGTTNITYQWQFQQADLTFTDIPNGGAYSGVNSATLSVDTGIGTVSLAYRCRINGDLATEQISNMASLLILSAQTAPAATGATGCAPSSLTLVASGGADGEYRWYTVSTGGTPILGETSSTYTTPSLTSSVTYFVSLMVSCESTRTPVTATINTGPAKPAITSSITPATGNVSVCSNNSLALTAPSGFSSYTWSNGETTQQITITSSGSYTVTVETGNGCDSPPSDPINVTVLPAPCANESPVIATTQTTSPIAGNISINLTTLISDVDDNLDLPSLKIVSPPVSGAQATLINSVLTIDYAGLSFSGPDRITVEVCDLLGSCTQQELIIEVVGDLIVYNGMSPNGDMFNDKWIIKNIEALPDTRDNKVSIFNRWGDLIFEVSNYNNTDRVFIGIGSNGHEVTSGVYYYKIKFLSGRKELMGNLVVKR